MTRRSNWGIERMVEDLENSDRPNGKISDAVPGVTAEFVTYENSSGDLPEDGVEAVLIIHHLDGTTTREVEL